MNFRAACHAAMATSGCGHRRRSMFFDTICSHIGLAAHNPRCYIVAHATFISRLPRVRSMASSVSLSLLLSRRGAVEAGYPGAHAAAAATGVQRHREVKIVFCFFGRRELERRQGGLTARSRRVFQALQITQVTWGTGKTTTLPIMCDGIRTQAVDC